MIDEKKQKQLNKVIDQITKLLKANNCGIVPVVQIFNNQISSRVEIVLLEEKDNTIVKS